MKKLSIVTLALALALTSLFCAALAESAAWAYGALPLNSGDYGVATIYYTEAYYAQEGIVNPTSPDYAPYTAEEIAAIAQAAAEGAEGYRFDAPEGALIGMSVYGNEDVIYWYDAENASAITSHPDPLHMDVETGVFYTADDVEVASPIQ